MVTFTIADTDICWHKRDFTPRMGKFSDLFVKESLPEDTALHFSGRVEPLDRFQDSAVLRKNDRFWVLEQAGQRYYLYHPNFPDNRFLVPYTQLRLTEENRILFSEGYLSNYHLSFDWFLGVSGLHKLLLQRGIAIFHASYIDIGGQALLFAGPSGTGKSTQGQLWAKYAGAQVINGDRVAIGMKNSRYHAYGYPACGSSGICINRTLPIRAIILLEQSLENKVLPMAPGEKFRAVLSGMTINAWEEAETELAMELAEKWISQIPMYRLCCRPDGDAVDVLRTFLQA